jgi:hypothetical protein
MTLKPTSCMEQRPRSNAKDQPGSSVMCSQQPGENNKGFTNDFMYIAASVVFNTRSGNRRHSILGFVVARCEVWKAPRRRPSSTSASLPHRALLEHYFVLKGVIVRKIRIQSIDCQKPRLPHGGWLYLRVAQIAQTDSSEATSRKTILTVSFVITNQ